MSGLSDEFATIQSPPKPKCTIQWILGQLDQEDGAVLVTALQHPDQPPTSRHLSSVLNRRGLKVGESTIRRHRQRGCQGCEEAGLYG